MACPGSFVKDMTYPGSHSLLSLEITCTFIFFITHFLYSFTWLIFGFDRNLGDVGLLSNYTHLRYIYLARNVLLDMRPFCALSNLLLLDMTENLLTAEEYQIPVLQTLEVGRTTQLPLSYILLSNIYHSRSFL